MGSIIEEINRNKTLMGLLVEQYSGGIIKEGDVPCDIWCEKKYAKRGSTGDVVKMIQHLLARGCGDYGPYNPEKRGGGINEGCAENWTNCDGKFGKETKKAVEEYQGDYKGKGLVVDGSVGTNTLSELCELCYKNNPVFPDDFTLCDKQCQCTKDTSGGDGNFIGVGDDTDWFLDMDISPEYGNDCDSIKSCLQYVSGKDGEYWHHFLKCMKKGGFEDKTGTQIPDWFKDDCMKWIPYDWEKGGLVICISDQGNSMGPYYSDGKGILIFPDGEAGEYYKNLKITEEEAKELGIKWGGGSAVAASECCGNRKWKA